ncbi:MAG: molybdenum cofactor guanylyltransferase [Chloroflexi bacterium]|nr:MAG: molybdenum cofactor guanylyltransferase [Chloroflexota bacterium]
MTDNPSVSVAILAGGRSKRMGRDKAFLTVGGVPVIERVIARVRSLTDDLFISTNNGEKYRRFGLPTVPDVIPDKAALGGIYSAICAAKYAHVLVVACDMPFLNRPLLKHLIRLAPTADVVTPRIHTTQPETLHAVYAKACLPAIEAKLAANRLRIIGFFDDVTVRYLEAPEISQFDPQFHSFLNMNTPDDWQKLDQLANIEEC